MYNGIGLTTPRGSGTNGYVTRNLSALRPHQHQQDRDASWGTAPPKHREPDAGILEHERKRGVEIKCLELQLQLEDEGVEEGEIEARVQGLRLKLLAAQTPLNKRPTDTHGMAAAKKLENDRMARAFGVREFVEGDAFNREKQAEEKARRAEEWKKKDEERQAREAERKERDRLRRREEDRRRREGEQQRRRSPRPGPRRDSRSPPRRRSRSRSPPPPPRRLPARDARSRSPASRSPPPRRRSPPPRDRRSRSPPPKGARRRSASPSSGSEMSVSDKE